MQRPPTPKGEKPSVTIANLERENDNLVRRIEDLSKRINQTNNDNRNLELALDNANRDLAECAEAIETAMAKVGKLESILCGYRQAVADVHHTGVEMVQE